MRSMTLGAGILMLLMTGHANAQSTATADQRTSEITDVRRIVERFHKAMEAGDSAAVLAMLADDAMILESGDAETRGEYRTHHLPADIDFAKAVKSKRGPVDVRMHGTTAWTTATSSAKGKFKGRVIDSAGAESMVLTRVDNKWKIRSIHWSSHKRDR
jgi:ketosteroid isomerase-like protein